jgi:hypothetical protein
MQKDAPFAKDLITSTRPKFHTMVVNGQPNTQNPNEKKLIKNESTITFLNSYTFKNFFKNQSPLDG